MQYLVVTKDEKDVDWTRLSDVLEEEARQIWRLIKQGVIRNIWFTEDREAVIMIEAFSREEVASVMRTLPLVTEKTIRYEITGLTAYDGFERIMRPKP